MKKKTLTIIEKHILSGFHSFASGDVWLFKKIKPEDVDFSITKNSLINSKKNSFLNGEEIEEIVKDKDLIIVYLKSDKTFYNKALKNIRSHINFSKTDEFQSLVNEYIELGFGSTEKPQEIEMFWQRESDREYKKRKKEGFVFHKPLEELKPKDYQGGFSNEVMNNNEMQKYVSKKAVFGWVGHSVRKPELDKAIEDGLRKRGLSSSKMFNWISSSNGRHFGDSLEGISLNEQLKKIENNLNSMFNLCLIYGDESHNGNYEDTLRIKEEMKQKKWLLPE